MLSLSELATVESRGRMKAFAYVTAEKASLYRAVMRVFMESKERLALHLRPQDIFDAIRDCGLQKPPDETETEAALEQLCEWGNLQTRPDTSDVNTVEDFYKQRYVFHITNQGEAAERALELFQSIPDRKGELQIHAVADICDQLHKLKKLAREAEPDSAKIYRTLLMLRSRFDAFTSRAQAFMTGVQRNIDLAIAESEQFTSDTQRLIDYMERFVSDLVIAAEDIAQTVREIETSGLERLLHAAAECSLVDAVETTPADVDSIVEDWRSHWGHIRSWFVSRPGCPSNAEILRARARASITDLLSVLTSVNDRRINRIDRSNDFRVLARWFGEAGSDADAHRLWRAVFSLVPARHLIVNDATLDDHEKQDVPPTTSWLDAPPLQISTRLRASGSYSRTGRLSRIIDRTSEKKKLAAVAHQEAVRILSAQRRFDTGRRMRLSEIQQLETGEFDLFLDLLAEAVSTNDSEDDSAYIPSNDGSLRLKLEPTGDGRVAVIQTPEGIFSGPDHWISVGANSGSDV